MAAVHAGYAKWRKDLLRAGISLYELRRMSPQAGFSKLPRARGSSSASSLHAKTFTVDGSHIFIGSFNFDPRSMNLNTEMGFLIESPALARSIAAGFGRVVARDAYQVNLSESGQLYWTEQATAGTVRHDTEPGTSFLQRVGIGLLSLLPIEWLL